MICILQMESWGPERGWGRAQTMSTPEFKPSPDLWGPKLFPPLLTAPPGHYSPDPHHHIIEHFLLWAAADFSSPPSHPGVPPSTWTRSSYLGRLAGGSLTMNKCSGETPSDSPNELRQSKPSRSSCFTEQADWAGSDDEEKQDGGACNSRNRLWSGSPRAVIIRNITCCLCMPAAVRGNKEHYADTPLLENVACSRSCSVWNTDHTNSNILHRLLWASWSHLSSILVGSLGYLEPTHELWPSADRGMMSSLPPLKRETASGRAQSRGE